MLNEKIEFVSYVCHPESESPRVQPKYLTDGFDVERLALRGIDQVMTVIARGFLFDADFNKELFDKDGLITDTAESDGREVLNHWCGFADDHGVQMTETLKKWFEKYPDAYGWLESYWKFWYKRITRKNDGKEQWKNWADKWKESLNSNLDYRAESVSFNNIIANALSGGPLRERYCIINKRNKNLSIKKINGLYERIFCYDKDMRKPTSPTNLKMLKNIIAFRILQEKHPAIQADVLMEKLRLLGWYGNDDRDGHLDVWFFEQFIYHEKPIMYRLPGNTYDYAKYGIAEEYLDEYGFTLIGKEGWEKYKEDHWILKDAGYGKDHPFEILNL